MSVVKNSDKYIVVDIAGGQYRVAEGDQVNTNLLDVKEGDSFDVDKVLLSVNGDDVEIGYPYLDKVKVKAKVIDHHLGDKVRIAKFKAKTGYRRVNGFRAKLSLVQIEKITL